MNRLNIKKRYFRLEWFPWWKTHKGPDCNYHFIYIMCGKIWISVWIGPLAIEIGHRP